MSKKLRDDISVLKKWVSNLQDDIISISQILETNAIILNGLLEHEGEEVCADILAKAKIYAEERDREIEKWVNNKKKINKQGSKEQDINNIINIKENK